MAMNIGDDVVGGLEKCQTWWQAAQAITKLIVTDGVAIENENLIFQSLSAQGFDHTVISKALEWFEKVFTSGNFQDVVGTIHSGLIFGVRIENPTESVFLPESLRKSIETWRIKGFINSDLIEKILASLRTMDTRDWDEEDIHKFVLNIIYASHIEPEQISHKKTPTSFDKPTYC
jgi:uncharacterized protein Smg (DUF494 family)